MDYARNFYKEVRGWLAKFAMNVQRTARTSAPWVDWVRFRLRLTVDKIIVAYT